MNLNPLHTLADDAIERAADVATQIANDHLESDRRADVNPDDAMDCMFDQGHAFGEALGNSDYDEGIVDTQPLGRGAADQFERANEQCGVDRTFEHGTPMHVPALGNPVLAFLEVAGTPTEANPGEWEHLGAQRQFIEGFDQGYRDGGIAAFDKGMDSIFQPDFSHPAGDVHANDMGGRPDLAAAIDAAFAPVSTDHHVDQSAGSSDTGAGSLSGAGSSGVSVGSDSGASSSGSDGGS
ncbi:MAG: hypothetical protein ACKO01_02405 [Erythrobacter sp.]